MQFNYVLKLWLVAVLMVLTISHASAQFSSKAVTGNFETGANWVGEVSPGTPITSSTTIVSGAVLTQTGDLTNNAELFVNGSLNIVGNYIGQGWSGISIGAGGAVDVSGAFSETQSITLNGNLSVHGDAILASSFTVKSGTVAEFYGDLNVQSINVELGATLIVHGTSIIGNWGSSVAGDVIILGDLETGGGTIESTANLVIGGNYTSTQGVNVPDGSKSNVYFLNPNAIISSPSWTELYSSNNYGNLSDFLTNEASNTTLLNLVSGLNILPVTWYSLASGPWSDASIWTLDPSGALAMNGGITTGPRDMDNYVIRSGKTVTVSGSAEVAGIVTVNGELDLGTITGNSFTKLKGSGRLVLHGDNYPVVGDDSHFVSAGQGEGTVVLKGSGRTMTQLPNDDLFDLEVALSGGAVVIDQDLNLNGDLNVLSGTLQINGTTATERSISVQNVTINSVASMTVGTGAEFHWLNVNGDFKNYGSVLFTNSASYAEAANGAVKVKFTGATNNDLLASGSTKFYRLFLNKGTDKTYILSVNATAAGLFALEGPVDGTSTDDKDGASGWERLPLVLNAGTLKLESNINLTRLGENRAGTAPNEFHIPYTSRLWINGATVSTASGPKTWGGITLYGTLHVSKGSFTTPEKTGGITYYTNTSSPGMLLIDGTGVVNTTQLKSGNDSGRFSYIQRGGVLNINAVSDSRVSSAVFALPHVDDSFEMSAGEIVIRAVNRYSSSNPENLVNGIHIALKEGNYNVSGGSIRILSPALDESTESNFVISSSIPFYNLSIENSMGADEPVVLQQPLTILNDLTIASGKSFNASGHALSIGGNFTNNGTYTTGDNITRFIGAGASLVTGGTIAFNHLELDKDASVAVVTLGAGTISITKNLTVTSGTLNIGTTNRNIAGNIEIVAGGITGTASLVLNGTIQQTIKGAIGVEQSFGNLGLNNSSGLKLLSNINVASFAFNTSGVVDLDVYNLAIDKATFTSSDGWSTGKMFKTAGLAANGGLSLPLEFDGSIYADNMVQYFPIGTSSGFTPVSVYAQGTLQDDGVVTIKPVDDYHPTSTDWTGLESLSYFWRVSYVGLSNITDVENKIRFRFTYHSALPTFLGSWRGWVMHDNQWNSYTGVEEGTSLNFGYGTYLTTDFTYGRNNPFNSPLVLYSRKDGQSGGFAQFDDKNSWTTDPDFDGKAASRYPQWYDMCVIGGSAGVNHTIIIDSNDDVSQIEIKGKSETGISSGNPPTLQMTNVGTDSNIDVIKGKGRVLSTDCSVPSSDFSQFCNNTEAIFEYSGGTNLPVATYYKNFWGTTYKLYDLNEYPNLHITGSSVKTASNIDLLINGNLYVDDATFNVSPSIKGNLIILGDVIVNTGNLVLPNGVTRAISVDGDINITGTGDFNVNTGGNVLEHQVNLKGNISQGNGDVDLAADYAYAKLSFIGTELAYFTKSGSGITEFYNVVINKPIDKKVFFNGDFDLKGSTSGATKALTLTSGECHLNHADINIDLSTGGSAFKIPSASILRVGNGATVNVSGSSTGIWLDGALIVEDKGIVNANGTADNYIEFTASGNSKIEVNGTGKLTVGSQVRRSLNTEAGVLKFYQNSNASAVVIGEKGAGEPSRGVLELPDGSVFTQAAGAKLTIKYGQAASSFPDLYFMPSTCTLGAGSEIIINGGDATNPFEIYATKSLAKLTTGGSSHVRIKTYPLTVGEDLTLGLGTFFDANGLDLNLYGHFINGGTFTANGNTTYFVGTINQNISGSTTFYNLEKTTTNTLTLSTANATVSNDLSIGAGILSTGDYNLYVGRDVVNNGTTHSTGASDGVIFNSGNSQQLSGVGTWSRLAITNSSEVVVPVQVSPIVINDRLKLNGGVFNIGHNLMSLGTSASIVHDIINDFSSTNMVQTNLSFTDNGIKKVFPQISSPTTFTFPIGSPGKYTPVSMSITSNGNNTGSIRVKAANEKHISIQDDPLTTIDETQNVLQYNWTLDATGMENFSADVTMKGLLSDAKVTSGNQLSDYITANILLSETKWNKNTNDDYNEGTGELYFKFDGTDDLGIDGDYTAGISSCIPNNLPVFISVNSGTWKDKLNWATYDPVTKVTGAAGVGVPAGGPRGSIIYVNTPIRMLDNSLAAYRTYIQSAGELSVEGTYGHRLGDVSGNGLLKLDLDVIPAGVYDNFFASTGGTLEYTSNTNDNYSILGDITAVNNLTLSGNGTRNFPDNDVLVRGKLTINGPVVDNVNSRTLTMLGDVELATGSYDPRSGKWILAGTTLQNVIGNIGLYDFQMNNGLRADIHDDCTVSNVLTLSKGILNTGVGGSLTITNPLSSAFVGGSSTSYVDGPLYKEISNSSSFTFPTGDTERYGKITVEVDATSQGIWGVEYFNHNPGDDNMSPSELTSPLVYVSHGEYWKVTAPDAGKSASLTMYWDENSGVIPDNNFRVVRWNSSNKWESVAINTPNTTNKSVSLTSSLVYSPVNYLTFGSLNIPSFTWWGDANSNDWFTAGNWSQGIVPGASADVTIQKNSGKPDPVVSGSVLAQTNNLVITSDNQLTLAPGAKMTVNGNVTNSGTLVLQHTTAAPSSFIYHGTSNGGVITNIQVDQQFIGALRKWYVGHVTSDSRQSDYKSKVPEATNMMLYKYNNGYVPITTDELMATPLAGYGVQFRNSPITISHDGNLNHNLQHTKSLTYTGWDLLANPYPSYIDLDTYLTQWDFSDVEKSVWMYTTTSTGARVFATYNLPTGLGTGTGDYGMTRYVAPLQAFWVKATTTGSFAVSPGARTHGDGSALKSVKGEQEDVLRLKLSNSVIGDETVIVFREIGGDEFSGEVDSEKRIESNTSIPFIASMKSGKQTAINVMPEDPTVHTIPLSIRVGAKTLGDLTLKASNITSFMPDVDVYLKDLETEEVINLRESPAYTFNVPAAVNDETRFELSFLKSVEAPEEEEGGSTTVETPSAQQPLITAYATDGKAIVNILDASFNHDVAIEVYDAQGGLFTTLQSAKSRTEVSLPDNTQVVIVKVIYKEVVKSFKLLKPVRM